MEESLEHELGYLSRCRYGLPSDQPGNETVAW
jgi:hypothetical protein